MTARVVQLIDLPVIEDARGCLGIAQEGAAVPFTIRRLFYLFELEQGANRGYHAHRAQHQFVIMLSGRCDIVVKDGGSETIVTLKTPRQGLYVPPMLWLELRDFSPGSVCAVLTSDVYDEADYVRDFAEFERIAATMVMQ